MKQQAGGKGQRLRKQDRRTTVSLGFTDKEFAPGVHICQVFSSDAEREEALLKFILSGLQGGERVRSLTDRTSPSKVAEFLGEHGVNWKEAVDSGALANGSGDQAYFQNGRFDLELMLELLESYYWQATEQFSGARLIGEMAPRIQTIQGGARLLEYESRVSLLLRKCPVTTVCQYDARLFSGAMIMDVLKVHPLMIIRGTVVNNPFYIKPEEYLVHEV